MAAPPANSLYPPFVAQGSSEFKHSMSVRDRAPPTDIGGGAVVSRGGVIPSMENKGRKRDYASNLLPHSFHGGQDSSNMMGELPLPLDSTMPPGMVSEPPSSDTGTFQSMLASQDDSSLQANQALRSRYPVLDPEPSHLGASSKSLSHPNLSTISPRPVPRGTPSAIPVHSQPIPFPANLGGFTLSSMVGHFNSPHLQPQSLSMNPAAGGLMQGLGLSVGSNPAQPPTSIAIAQSLALPNPAVNPSISIMNPLPPPRGSGTRPNLPPSTSLPMPLTHPIATNLHNPSLPLIPGMPNMYSYPYAATLPTQPATTSVNAPVGFPPQSLVPPGYSQYLPPSLYGNSPQQPPGPVSTGNFSR